MEIEISKETADKQKLRGGYYTPPKIAAFLSKWAIQEGTERILEPSCGDGNFIEASLVRLKALNIADDDLRGRIKGVELLKEEAEKAQQRALKFGLNSDTIENLDFFQYRKKHPDERYDVVLGNPPFIRYQNFPEKHRALAISMMEKLGLHPNKLTNIWVPFLVLSADLLNENGRLGMVIPAELFQVKYAAETRIFLSEFFQRVTIITFKKLVFEDIQQEVVLLLCEKRVDTARGIRVVELNVLDDLEKLELSVAHEAVVKSLEHNSEKWTKYFLEEDEIHLLRRIKTQGLIRPAGEILDVNVGIVTGCNDFFMLKESEAEKLAVLPFTKKVVSKSAHFKGIAFTTDDFRVNAATDVECYLFLPPDAPLTKLSQACKRYIAYGVKEEYNLGYKCKIRKRWYITPSIAIPAAFALRQVADYPKLIINRTDVSSTDTIHRVGLRTDLPPELIAISFLNSLTFAFSEITGRSYGGGVLTFEPTEIEELPMPILEGPGTLDFAKIDALMRGKKIMEVLEIVDKALLIDQYGFTQAEVLKLRNIWQKLASRRQNRK